MLEIDYYFFYNNIIRNILFLKMFNLRNTYAIPYLKKICLFFSLFHINDIDDVQIYNYLYLFKYFFGKRAFLTKKRALYSLGNGLIL